MFKKSQRSIRGFARSWDLTAEQNEQMKNIWEGLHNSGRSYEDRRHRLRDERDEAIAALMAPSVMGDYDRCWQDLFQQADSSLGRSGIRQFAEAVEKTKKILTAEQRVKYEEFLKRREPRPMADRGGFAAAGGPIRGLLRPAGDAANER
jgi:Spy/CpxP family protein refolding chaperone